MPYGIADEVWRKLPSDDRAVITAGSKSQPAPAIGGYPPGAPTPAPPPQLVYGIPADLWRRLPPDDQAAVRAESRGETPPPIGGYTPAAATPAPPPNLSAPGASRTAPMGGYPAAASVTTSESASSIKPNPSVGWTRASQEARIGQARSNTTSTAKTPSDEIFPPGVEILKTVLEATTPDEILDAFGEGYVRKFWTGPRFTDAQLRAAFKDIFWGAEQPDPANSRFIRLRRSAIAEAVQSGFDIELELKHTADPGRARSLRGQLSAISLAVWVVTEGTYGGVLPGAVKR